MTCTDEPLITEEGYRIQSGFFDASYPWYEVFDKNNVWCGRFSSQELAEHSIRIIITNLKKKEDNLK